MKKIPCPRQRTHELEVMREIICEDAGLEAKEWFRQFEWQEGPRATLSFLDTLCLMNATLREFWLVYRFCRVADLEESLQVLSAFKSKIGPKRGLELCDLVGDNGEPVMIN